MTRRLLIAAFAAWLLVRFFGGKAPTAPQSAAADLEALALGKIQVNVRSVRPFGVTAITLDAKIENGSQFSLKDLELRCLGTAQSGTRIGRDVKTIYQTFAPGEAKVIPTLRFSITSDQLASVQCKVLAAKRSDNLAW